ncbi:hypothetical protein [Desulfofalx alkaliphila]|uniref:hypothetical protein n=1 Tax=Desulfofalx alkaliphila TaxID=105483 RepID=UPI0004E2778F|nr:hypothetical protein [Desulfofalx alkaliphila]
MNFKEIDEKAALEFFEMLKDAPTIREIIDTYPGVENLIHVMTAQLTTHFLLPYLENNLAVEDLVESIRRYLITALAFGIILHRNDVATDYILDLYNKDSYKDENSAG